VRRTRRALQRSFACGQQTKTRILFGLSTGGRGGRYGTSTSFNGPRTLASLAVMMAFLATEVGHEEALRTLGMAFAGGQLPSAWTTDALVSAGAAASHAAQITLGTRAHVAIISERGNGHCTRARLKKPHVSRVE